jgi:predicted N-formylglutamate amidohydrolase
VSQELDAMTERGLVPILLSVHSFTHVWRGVLRKWHAGVLWDKDPRLALPLLKELQARTGLEIGDNEPYSGRLRGNCIYQHGTLRGIPNALIELRQDLIQDEPGQSAWGALLTECLASIFANPGYTPALSRVDYFGSYTDIHQGERHSL